VSGNEGAAATGEQLESGNGSTGLSRQRSWITTSGYTPRERDNDSRVIHKQRRCGSMKRMMFLGALVLGVTVCSQSFGFELLDRMLGCKGCTSCCEPACDAGMGGCEPACGVGAGCAEPACDAGVACCEPGCAADAGCCGVRKKHALFGGLKGLFEKCKRKHHGCTDSCCEPACGAGNGCAEPACGAGNGCAEPACGAGNGCAEPACDAGVACCEPGCAADAGCCGVRKKCTPIRDFLKALHSAKKCRSSCTSCCGAEADCSAGAGCCEPGCGAEPACAASPNCSASTKTPGKVVAVSRTIAVK